MAPGIPLDSPTLCPRCGFTWNFLDVDGGTNYRCGGCEWWFGLGLFTAASPAVPASGVPATNTTGSLMIVTISGGTTVTTVLVNGVSAGSGDGVYQVPAGGTISVAYVAAPAWVWALPALSSTIAAGATALPIAAASPAVAVGTQLLIDTGTSAELLTVGSGSTTTSIAIPAGTSKAHNSATAFGTPKLTPEFGSQAVPPASPWPALQPSTF